MKSKQVGRTLLAVGLLLALVSSMSLAQEPEGQAAAGPAAAVGTAFTYQGRLSDSSGPVNGTCDFRFRLFDAASDGNQVGVKPNHIGNDKGYHNSDKIATEQRHWYAW